MVTLRSLSIALAAAVMLAAAGCRTAGVGNLTKSPGLFPSRTDDGPSQLLAAHNRNAARIQSLEARPDIKVVNRRMGMGAGGKLAMERPRNFKLELQIGFKDVANIGSNDDEFWFWVSGSDEKYIYYCDYDENGASPLAGGLQPEWITEAMGVKVIPEDQMAGIKVRAGEPGTLVLTATQTDPQGESIFKEIVLSESTRRVREHRVYAADHKTLLAHATVTEYQEVAVPATPGVSGATEGTVFLPKTLKLEWPQQKLSLQIWLNGVQVNPKFDEAQRAAIFVEPKIRGFERKNLAEWAGAAQPRASSAATGVRESMPAPPPRVKLGEPTSLGPQSDRKSSRAPSGLLAQSPSATRPVEIEPVVGSTIPTVAEPRPESLGSRPGFRNTVER